MTIPAARYTPGATSSFSQGTTPSPFTGHTNAAPVAPVGAASHGLDFEGVQRLTGSVGKPASFGKFLDELSGGSDSFQSGEE